MSGEVNQDTVQIPSRLGKMSIAVGIITALVTIVLYLIAPEFSGGWKITLNSIAASLTATLLFSVADYGLSRREHDDYVIALGAKAVKEMKSLRSDIEARENFKQVGISDAFVSDRSDSCLHEERRIIRNSDHLRVVLNTGAAWMESYKQAFSDRFRDDSKSTRIYLLDQDSPCFDLQADKENVDHQSLVDRQLDAVAKLDDACPKDSNGAPLRRYELLHHWYFSPYLVLLSENEAIIAPYFAATGHIKPPAFEFKKSGGDGDDFYSKIKGDVENLASTPN